MHDLPANFSVVSDLEFQSLRYLPDFELRGDCLCRVNDAEERFIMPQSLYERWQQSVEKVEVEEQRVSDNALVEVIDPSVVPTPQPKHDDGIPPGDIEAARRSGILGGPLPDHPESSRKPSWFRGGFDPWGGR